jgi:glycosyltransferase involved in cell wall biosynthesis
MLSAYPPGHYGTVARLTRWIPHLAARGIEAEVLCPATDAEFAAFGHGDVAADYRYHRATLANRARQIPRAAAADAIVLHRGLLPFGPWQRPTFEHILARANPRLVYDYYDSIWEQRRIIHAAGGRVARWLNRADLVEAIARECAVVTAATSYLADFARPFHSDVRVLPMLLDPEACRPVRHGPRERLTLGWMGGRGNLRRLESIAPALAVAATRTPLRLVVVSGEPVEIAGVEVECRTHPWSVESEREDLAGFDVGLLPLFDDAEDRGKFPFKLLQYAAAGLPIVASPVAIDEAVFADGEAILYARGEADWAEAIARLAAAPALRASLGAAARRAVEEHYSFARHADAFAEMLRDVARLPERP